MFWNNKKKKLEMIQAIRPTSKATLKIQCLFACKGDIDEAKKLYEYFAGDMQELPEYDPVQPTWVDNTKEVVNGLMGWAKENQDTIGQVVEFVRGAIRRRGAGMIPAADAVGTVAGMGMEAARMGGAVTGGMDAAGGVVAVAGNEFPTVS